MSKKGGGGSGAHDYFGTIAGLVCAGPVDELVAIIADGKTVWPDATRGEWQPLTAYTSGDTVAFGGRVWMASASHASAEVNAPGTGGLWAEVVLRRSDPGVGNPVTVDVVGYGSVILYWGAADQVLDASLSPGFAAEHPPYRRQCFVILKDFYFGRERVSAPNVEIVVRRRPHQAVVPSVTSALDEDGQANPVAAIADLMTDPVHGPGLPLSAFNLARWGGTVSFLGGESGRSYLSPVIATGTQIRGAVSDLVPYIDGWFRWGPTGRVEAGVFPRHPGAGTWPTIDVHSLIDEPQYDTQGHPDTVNEVTVRFTDRTRAYKQGGQQAAIGDRDEPRDAVLDRPWITRPDQAAGYAAEFVQMFADSGQSGTVSVIASKAAVLPGDLFWLSHSALGMTVLCRCEAVSYSPPPADRATISFTSERSLQPMAQQEAAVPSEASPAPAPATVTLFRLVQPPQALHGGNDYRLVVLAARPDPTTTSMVVHMRDEDPTLFVSLGGQSSWAVTGTLTQSYSADPPDDDDSESLRIDLDPSTPDPDRLRIFATQSADAIADDSMLVWAFTSGGSYEVMTLKAIRLDGDYRLKVRRRRLGTVRRNYVAGDRVWIIPRADVVTYQHALFEPLSLAAGSAVFRLQPRNIWRTADLFDPVACPDVTYTFNNQHPPPPIFDFDFGVVSIAQNPSP